MNAGDVVTPMPSKISQVSVFLFFGFFDGFCVVGLDSCEGGRGSDYGSTVDCVGGDEDGGKIGCFRKRVLFKECEFSM